MNQSRSGTAPLAGHGVHRPPPWPPRRPPGRSTSAPPQVAEGGAGQAAFPPDHGAHPAEAADGLDPAAVATGLAQAVPGEEGGVDIEIISSGDDYSEDPYEPNTFGGLFGEHVGPPDAAMNRIQHMERQYDQLGETVDNMGTQLAGVLASQAQLAEHVTGLERGLAVVVTQQQTATADAAALRGDIQALLGQLSGGTVALPHVAPPASTKVELPPEGEAAPSTGPTDPTGLAGPSPGSQEPDKGQTKGRPSQGPY